jgi:hypothetical protein
MAVERADYHRTDDHVNYQYEGMYCRHRAFPAAALQTRTNSAALSDAPPTSPPSMSGMAKSAEAFEPFTLPP